MERTRKPPVTARILIRTFMAALKRCVSEDATLNLYEQQSSYNPNMPLRGLSYLAKQYEKFVESNHLNVYRDTLCKIPAPRYVVFYNGNDIQPDRRELKLSDAFITQIDDAALEVRAIMLNINYGQNKKIMKASVPLNDYSKFVSYVKMNQRKGLAVREAVDAAVDRAIEEKLLDGYFAAHKAEVIGMILTEYDEEFVHKGWFEDGREKGLAEGLAKGLEEGLAKGREEERLEIASLLGYSPEEFAALLAEKKSSRTLR